MHIEPPKIQNTNRIPKEKQIQQERIKISNFKVYYRAIIPPRYQHKIINTLINGTEHYPKINPHTYSQLIFLQRCKEHTLEEEIFSRKVKTGYVNVEQKNYIPRLCHIQILTQDESKTLILNAKTKTIRRKQKTHFKATEVLAMISCVIPKSSSKKSETGPMRLYQKQKPLHNIRQTEDKTERMGKSICKLLIC